MKKIKKRVSLYICLLLFFCTYHSRSQDFDPRLIQTYNNILDLKLREDFPVLHSENFKTTENKAFQIYLKNLRVVIDLLLVKDKEKYKTYLKEEKDQYQLLDGLGDDVPFANYLKIELKLRRGLLKIRYGDRSSGALNLIQAFRQSKILEETHTGHQYTLKTIGLLNVVLSLFPDQFNWILNIMQVNPDITKGVYYLKELSESTSIFKREGILLYALSQSFYSDNPDQAIKVLDDNYQMFDKSLLYNYLYGLTSIKSRNNEAAIEYLDSCLKYDRSYLQIPLINYYRAESYLKALNFNKAAYLYKLYLQKPDGGEFVKDSNYKLFNLSVLYGIPDQNNENYKNEVLKVGSLQTGSDKYAYQRIINNYKPDSTLFNSRILFDGGYYVQSLEILRSKNSSLFSSVEEISEYLYRYARNYQQLGKVDPAIDYFKKVINTEGA